MISIGINQDLTILRETSVGLFLGDDEGEDVLLPNKYVPENFKIGEKINVFVYRDHEERKVATTLEPGIRLHEFAFLKVSSTSPVGAFLDWGMEKELLVPFREQRLKMEQNRWYVVYLDLDGKTDRLFASNKLDNYLTNDNISLKKDEEVDLIVYHRTELGYSVIVNQKHKGLIYKNEVYRELKIGDKLKGFVKEIRADRKIDIRLQAAGYKQYNDQNTQKLLERIKKNHGVLKLTDKSSPEDIYRILGMSKKAFKQALGGLYKDRVVEIKADGIRLI